MLTIKQHIKLITTRSATKTQNLLNEYRIICINTEYTIRHNSEWEM